MSPVINITDLHAVAELIATRMVDSLLQGTILACFAGLLLATLRHHGSRMRFAVWFAVLVAIVAVPLLGLIWPHGMRRVALTRVYVHSAITLPGSWGLYLFASWSIIAGLALAQIVMGLWRLRRMRRTCVPAAVNGLPTAVQETLARFQPRRNVGLYTSSAVQAPTAIGFFRPTIVMPAWLMDELSTEDLNHVLLHELAHIRRWDDWTNLAQKIVRALLFFHPVVWWIERRISLEREMACDEAVVATTANPRAYAECLALLAERTFKRRSLELVQAAVSRVRQTSARVAKILGGGRPVVGPIWKPAVPLVTVFCAVCLILIACLPDVVVFRDPGSAATAHANLAVAGDVAHVAGPAPLMARTGAVPVEAGLNGNGRHSRPFIASARVHEPVVPLAARRPSRVNGWFGGGSATVVVLVEEVKMPGAPAGQLRVWRVMLLRAPNNNDNRKAT